MDRELLELLNGLHHRTEFDASGTLGLAVPGPEAVSVCRKVIQAEDVCPICQEELLQKKQPVSYCRCLRMKFSFIDQNMTLCRIMVPPLHIHLLTQSVTCNKIVSEPPDYYERKSAFC